jgi:hypothetical protein
MDSVQREAQITLALADLANQEHPNFKGTARAYKVNHTTLYRRFDSVQCSYAQCRSETYQNLTSSQEKVLIDYINQLTDRSSPPTSQYIKNFAEELCKKPVSKNWVSNFTCWYKDQLCTKYLQSIDQRRVTCKGIPFIIYFYKLVSL